MKLKFENSNFCGSSCSSEEKWNQINIFFIEYGTVVRLEERTEHCMPALWTTQSTKTIFHCTLAVAFKLELIKQARSQLIQKIRYGIHEGFNNWGGRG